MAQTPVHCQKPQSREERLLHAILDKMNAGGGGEGSLSIHICTTDEYNHITGVPTIQNPSETTFYMVPSGSTENDLYQEWVYVDGNWEKFGSGTLITTTLASLADVTILAPDLNQALVYDATSNRWRNKTLNSVCFIQDGEEDFSVTANPTISFDSTTGIITASVSSSENISGTISPGFVSGSSASGTASISGSSTYTVPIATIAETRAYLGIT